MDTYKESLISGLERLLADPKCFLLGEDIADPYGGAYAITKGMSAKFSGKIINTPMSEQGFTGLGVGMALAGYKPIIEIMFGDFSTLIMDQLLNHASKFVEGFEKEILEAVALMTHEDDVPYLDYVAKLKNNPIARAVKLADLAHNSDLSRIGEIDEETRKRLEKYKKAIALLKGSIADE